VQATPLSTTPKRQQPIAFIGRSGPFLVESSRSDSLFRLLLSQPARYAIRSCHLRLFLS
jgi:hypothetical protein